jgi:hypothetical protein
MQSDGAIAPSRRSRRKRSGAKPPGKRHPENRSKPLPSWSEHQKEIASLAESQLFFVGGAPRSGTTWLQYLLDSHPDICCQGEGLFMKCLAEPLESLVSGWREALAAKNSRVFQHSDGYPLPEPGDAEILLGTGILLALKRQCAGKAYRAVGEKTPENVFFFDRLKLLFPRAKFVGIVRDPRDQMTSAWHFFGKASVGDNEAAKIVFIRNALQSVNQGAHAMLALRDKYRQDCMIVTYERMHGTTASVAAQLFRFLGVSDSSDVVADCVARTSFTEMTDGRPPGVAQDGSFFRKGVVGDWRSTVTPEINDMILRELGWMFSHFGWMP